MTVDLNWIKCPKCPNPHPQIKRNLGDQGGTESYTIQCQRCKTRETITP